jgi:[acyl-carrier-protein] S-malonyltransferase
MATPLVFLFPGQTSRDAEMLDRLERISPRHADQVRGVLRANGAPADSNLAVQLSVLAMSLAYLGIANECGLRAIASAGMSLGEYAHLVHIGALTPEAAIDLILERGRLYDAGPEGAMVALQPVASDEVERLVQRVSSDLDLGAGELAVSNINSPSQCVVAGRRDAVAALGALAEDELCAIPKVIESRIPMHCARFLPVAHAFRPHLEAAPWCAPKLRYRPNVTGEALASPNAPAFVELLTQHVHRRVLWQSTVDGLLRDHPGAVLVEVGPRRALSAVFGRRWHPGVRCLPLDLMDDASPEAFAAHITEIHDATH